MHLSTNTTNGVFNVNIYLIIVGVFIIKSNKHNTSLHTFELMSNFDLMNYRIKL